MRCLNQKTIGENTFPCGKCIFCRESKINEWRTRMSIENLRNYGKSNFITLTYQDNQLIYLENQPVIIKSEIQNFMKRLRQNIKSQGVHDVTLKYMAVGEYGDLEQRPHYHIIMFGLPKIIGKLTIKELIQLTWNKGFIQVKPFKLANISYILTYINKYKINEEPLKGPIGKEIKKYMPFMLVSKGMGKLDLKQVKQLEHRILHTDETGIKMPTNVTNHIPKYYRENMTKEANNTYLEKLERIHSQISWKQAKNLYNNKLRDYGILKDETSEKLNAK